MNWFKSKNNEPQIEVQCPNCRQVQSVSENISAVFCKNCKKTIYTKKAAMKSSSFSRESREQEKVPDSAPPKIAGITELPLSASEEQKPPPVQIQQDAKPAKPFTAASATVSSPHSSSMKQIKCSNCSAVQEVPSIALASFCEKCGQRINLQDYKIKGKFHGELETRGEIKIAAGAEVKANLNVGVAVIEGRIDGKITAETRVELNDGGLVVGVINSPTLIVHEGAGFIGKAVINPKPFDS